LENNTPEENNVLVEGIHNILGAMMEDASATYTTLNSLEWTLITRLNGKVEISGKVTGPDLLNALTARAE